MSELEMGKMKDAFPDRAVVVIHGIGEQRRGNTLDAFVRGLKRCGVGDAALIQENSPFDEPLPPDAVRVTRGDVQADIYEVYWAPHTARKTTARSVLWWLLRASFIPTGKIRRPSAKTWWDISAAGLAMLLLAFVVLYGVTSLGNLSAQVACRADPEVKCELPPDQRKVTGPEVTWGGGGQVGAVAQALWGSFNFSDRPLKELTPEHAAEVLTLVPLQYWIVLMVVAFLSVQALYRVTQILSALVQGEPRRKENRIGWQLMMLSAGLVAVFFLVQLVAPVLTALLVVVVLVGAFVRSGARFLSESLGDVQVYSERDENSEHYEARESVLAEAEKTFALVAKRGYRTIVVVGHSLGSVIAFTALDRLRRRIPALLSRIDTFITFGSALEKVLYFFERRKDPDEEASARLVQPAAEIAEGRTWLNLWYANDLVANPITSFQPEDEEPVLLRAIDLPVLADLLVFAKRHLVVNINYGYPILRLPLVWTHSRYWGDKSVMKLITDISLPASATATWHPSASP